MLRARPKHHKGVEIARFERGIDTIVSCEFKHCLPHIQLNYLHVQISHLSGKPCCALGSDRPNDELSIPPRRRHLRNLAIRSPLVRVHPGNGVLVHREQQPIRPHCRSTAGRGGLRARDRRARLTPRVGLLEPVKRLVIESPNPAGGSPARRGRRERARAGRGGVIERVGEGPARLVACVENGLAVVARSDEAVLGDERQGEVGQGREADGDVRRGGLTGGRGVHEADG